jgi:hypothetical protein
MQQVVAPIEELTVSLVLPGLSFALPGVMRAQWYVEDLPTYHMRHMLLFWQ